MTEEINRVNLSPDSHNKLCGSAERFMKLLCLSNGHGEDAIAIQIAQALRRHPQAPEIAALPIVGAGHAYQAAEIPIVGPVKAMPSGGFIYMDSRQLWQDIQGGLLGLTLAQIRVARRWAKDGGKILAVGDIVPLAIAAFSGATYGFVGTAKSEYYIRDDRGQLLKSRRGEGWSGSVYLPWERWLMGRSPCRAVYPRDGLTTTILKRHTINAYNLGNPMMDGLVVPRYTQSAIPEEQRPLMVLLLPGSRSPEAQRNWQTLITTAQELCRTPPTPAPLLFLAALAPGLEAATFLPTLTQYGWRSGPLPSVPRLTDPEAQGFQQGDHRLVITQRDYATCLNGADMAIAMAGTATEQFVGLGKPAITLPGTGPQFTPQFAEAQTRLLGVSVTLLKQPQDVPKICQSLLGNPDTLQIIAENGDRRMGQPGAAARIADHLLTVL